MNSDRLLKLAKALEKVPDENFDMGCICHSENPDNIKNGKLIKSKCNSAACALGWIPTLFPRWGAKLMSCYSKNPDIFTNFDGSIIPSSLTNFTLVYEDKIDFGAARLLFDIDHSDVMFLFDTIEYNPPISKQMVIDRINKFVKDKKDYEQRLETQAGTA